MHQNQATLSIYMYLSAKYLHSHKHINYDYVEMRTVFSAGSPAQGFWSKCLLYRQTFTLHYIKVI